MVSAAKTSGSQPFLGAANRAGRKLQIDRLGHRKREKSLILVTSPHNTQITVTWRLSFAFARIGI
jgi:hypothetical protein